MSTLTKISSALATAALLSLAPVHIATAEAAAIPNATNSQSRADLHLVRSRHHVRPTRPYQPQRIFFENCWWTVTPGPGGTRRYKKFSCPDLNNLARGIQRPGPPIARKRR